MRDDARPQRAPLASPSGVSTLCVCERARFHRFVARFHRSVARFHRFYRARFHRFHRSVALVPSHSCFKLARRVLFHHHSNTRSPFICLFACLHMYVFTFDFNICFLPLGRYTGVWCESAPGASDFTPFECLEVSRVEVSRAYYFVSEAASQSISRGVLSAHLWVGAELCHPPTVQTRRMYEYEYFTRIFCLLLVLVFVLKTDRLER